METCEFTPIYSNLFYIDKTHHSMVEWPQCFLLGHVFLIIQVYETCIIDL